MERLIANKFADILKKKDIKILLIKSKSIVSFFFNISHRNES